MRCLSHIFITEVLLASDATPKETAGSVCATPKHVTCNDVDLGEQATCGVSSQHSE